MIVNLKKFLFLGALDDLNRFFDAAQRKGMIEFIPAKPLEIKQTREIQEFIESLKILKHYPFEHHIYPEGVTPYEIVTKVLHLQESLQEKAEQKVSLQTEMLKISPLGEFSLEEISEIEKSSDKKFYFYFAKRSSVFEHEDLILINTDHEFDFYLSFTQKQIEDPLLSVLEIKESLSSLKDKLKECKSEIKKFEQALKQLAPYSDFVRHELVEKINQHELVTAKHAVETVLEDQLFSVTAWIPENKENELIGLTQNLSVHFEEVRVEEHDRVPTYMQNKGAGKLGEDLVHIYDVPSHQDKDPSRWVLFAFAIFFAMIISDAAYGMIYLLIGLFLQYKIKKPSSAVKRAISTIKLVASFTIFWGVMAGAYFSIPLNQESFLMKFSGINHLVKQKVAYHIKMQDDVYQELIHTYPQNKGVKDPKAFIMNAKDPSSQQLRFPIQEEFTDNVLLELSLLFGILHLSFSFLRNLRSSYPGIGWVMAMFGGYLYFPGFLNATSLVHILGILSKSATVDGGFQLLIGGFSLAVLLSIYQNKWAGLNEITASIQVFADVLSYLRLYALGLAGMLLASTSNMMGKDVGFVAGAIIAILGHTINIALGVMAGMIHGLRLNFLEWYRYSFTGGGRLFKPLSLLKEKN